MPLYDKTSLWQQALATKIDDSYSKERERLRSAYENVRTRSQSLASMIIRDLPDYTVHDITHSDSLWEYADLIVGLGNPLNPSEAFVLGCAFLLHDLGMGLAAYPNGLSDLKKSTTWKDTVADMLRKKGYKEISDKVIENHEVEVEKQALSVTLRRMHAERADKLALIYWTSPTTDERFYLIEDPRLRAAYGPIIGRIAFSHWWPIDQVAEEFSAVMGAYTDFPQNWTVDPLKLACILRCADYSHIDERRAPSFLRALVKPEGASDDHWKFQSKLYQPRLEGDRLIFTAKSGFSVEDASAWWLCFDTLKSIDSELKKVDSLLVDTSRKRFAAKGVSQAEEPSRIAKLIKTDGWQPVDTRIHVSAVADLVSKLGGKELYGNSETPPLREMIQNAADAVRARRLIDDRAKDWGEINVTTGKDNLGIWIQVQDNGIGMSEAVVTGPLLDFGTTFWDSNLMHEQLPGLASKGFQATGRYGIGFFSVFMWGDKVEVVTQRFDRGRDDTLVLSFSKGLRERPILRQAKLEEHIPDGGSRVKVWFSDKKALDKLTSTYSNDKKLTLSQVCARIAPCLDITIKAEGNAGMELAITANDWISISDEALLQRISPMDGPHRMKSASNEIIPPPLKVLKNAEGRYIGRAALWSLEDYYSANNTGIVTVGGLQSCTLGGIVGVLVGSADRASRDMATPIIPIPKLTEWARSECKARLLEGHSKKTLESIAKYTCALGIGAPGFPIARTNTGWLTPEDIQELAKSIDEVLLVHDASVSLAGGKVAEVKVNHGVLVVGMGLMHVLNSRNYYWVTYSWPPVQDEENWGEHSFYSRAITGEVIRALKRGWGCSLEEILKASFFDSDKKRVEREIGTLAEKPHFDDVMIIRKPSGTSAI